MKRNTLLATVIGMAMIQFAPLINAQNPGPAGPRAGQAHREQRYANLSPDERQKLQAARVKALSDPAVMAAHVKMRQAHREFRDAMRSSMLKADPSIQPILSKVPEARRRDS
jgi:hypothetical protein